jgi:hypothetical protein
MFQKIIRINRDHNHFVGTGSEHRITALSPGFNRGQAIQGSDRVTKEGKLRFDRETGLFRHRSLSPIERDKFFDPDDEGGGDVDG